MKNAHLPPERHILSNFRKKMEEEEEEEIPIILEISTKVFKKSLL